MTTSVSRGNYASSFNLALPAEWLSGNVQLAIVVDPDNRITEVNETNNSLTQTLEFLAVPRLDLTIVPVQYTQRAHLPGADPRHCERLGDARLSHPRHQRSTACADFLHR